MNRSVEDNFLTVLKSLRDEDPGALYQYFNEDREALRARLKEIAYHEAGHVAARVFTWQEPSHICQISIMPKAESMGRVTIERPSVMCIVESGGYSDSIRRAQGYQLLLFLLAGDMAAEAATGDLADFDLDEWFDDFIDEDGTDAAQARRVAGAMSKPGWPSYKILDTARRWTAEMLMLPEVWQHIEGLANRLLDIGVVIGTDLDAFLSDSATLGLSMRLPKWRRRLHSVK